MPSYARRHVLQEVDRLVPKSDRARLALGPRPTKAQLVGLLADRGLLTDAEDRIVLTHTFDKYAIPYEDNDELCTLVQVAIDEGINLDNLM